ncbi:MAG: DNA polymerase I [Zetaproteobacteria bacterium]|nr:DNA polymerase I [Pseudobdellovibrionaceae bacterium]
MDCKKLFIIDGMAMAFRSYHAFSRQALSTKSGFPTSVLFGSAMFLLKLIEKESPDYLVLASDTSKKNFRHEIYPEYKANRKETPPDLLQQIEPFYKMIGLMGIPIIKQEGFEADDIIGSLVNQLGSLEVHSYMVSGDKDFTQLINEHTFLYSPKKNSEVLISTAKEVKEKYQCEPEQMIDFLAIMGDSSDNVPGVPGIGEKGAAKLIKEFGSLDEIYQRIDQVSNKRQQKALKENEPLARLSKKLVTIKTDMSLNCKLEDLIWSEDKLTANENLLDFFSEMEFQTLYNRILILGKKNPTAKKEKKSDETKVLSLNTEHLKEESEHTERNYKLVNNHDSFKEFLKEISAAKIFAFDTETTGLSTVDSKTVGISFSTKPNSGFYIPLCKEQLNDIKRETIISALQSVFCDEEKCKIAHNLKFDMQILANENIKVSAPYKDTMILSHLLNPNKSHSLDALSLEILNITKVTYASLFTGLKDKNIYNVDIDLLSYYACEDADCTLKIYEKLYPEIENTPLEKVYDQQELALVPILSKMEKNGILINSKSLKELSIFIMSRVNELEKEIYSQAGENFNINSPQQLQEILFSKLKIHQQLGVKSIKKTKSGYSTDISVLEKLNRHPITKNLIEYRTLTKLKNTYTEVLPEQVSSQTGRIHTSLHQTGTATGRLSSSQPNLQNIPIKTKLGQKIRESFIAKDQCVIISADYSQIELRVLAHLSKDPKLKEAFKEGHDIHIATAAGIFDKAIEDITKEERQQAKAINYGITYGMGAKKLSQTTGLSLSDARDFIEKYFARFPEIKNFIDSCVNKATSTGYCETLTGRKRQIPELTSSNPKYVASGKNIAINTPIQGSAADLIKKAMILIEESFTKNQINCNMLLQVHDELVFECAATDQEKAIRIITENMENALNLDIPVTCQIGAGANWWEAHQL